MYSISFSIFLFYFYSYIEFSINLNEEFPIGIPLHGMVRNCVEFKGLLLCIARIKIHLRWKPYVEFLTFNFKLKSRLVNIILLSLYIYLSICISIHHWSIYLPLNYLWVGSIWSWERFEKYDLYHHLLLCSISIVSYKIC